MASKPKEKYEIFGLTFDIIAAMISVVDLTTDIIILVTWYQQQRMTFFWISFIILLLGQISYIGIFYLYHGDSTKAGLAHSILSCLCTIPFAPVLSFIFYLVGDEDSLTRKFIDKYLPCFNFVWHDVNANLSDDQSPKKKYLEKKLYKHVGFLMEAFLEAFPQSILQLTAIVYYNEPNLISIISVLISMCSICGKTLLIILTEFRGYKMKLYIWLCLVVDFFGIFFVVSYAFYSTPDPKLVPYFITIRNLYLY